MTKVHDTLTDLQLGTPLWFVLSARLLPLGIVSQFLSAGAALFISAWDWQIHKAIGGALSLPIIVLCAGVLFISHLRGFSWWSGLVFILYVVQFALAAGGSAPLLAFHPVNGTLLLLASVVLWMKIERRVSRVVNEGAADRT